MPYLRITCPELTLDRRHIVARGLTDAINDLFFNPRSPVTREDLRERTTVHFAPYLEGDLFIGGRTPSKRGRDDITVELSDWNMSRRLQRKVACMLTAKLAELFTINSNDLDGINIRFHPYPPKDFAVGGRLLADLIPPIGRLSKRLFS